ncbi:20799_t:CDS:2, partial [Racocetra persica]
EKFPLTQEGTPEDWSKLSDLFGEKLKKLKPPTDVIPLTLRQLLNFLDDVAPKQKSFLVADGAHIKWSDNTSQINRQVRFVVVRQPNDKKKDDINQQVPHNELCVSHKLGDLISIKEPCVRGPKPDDLIFI